MNDRLNDTNKETSSKLRRSASNSCQSNIVFLYVMCDTNPNSHNSSRPKKVLIICGIHLPLQRTVRYWCYNNLPSFDVAIDNCPFHYLNRLTTIPVETDDSICYSKTLM